MKTRRQVHYDRLQRSKNYCCQKIKIRGVTIKCFINGKTVVINLPINKHLTEQVQKNNADIQPKFVDDTKIWQIETT